MLHPMATVIVFFLVALFASLSLANDCDDGKVPGAYVQTSSGLIIGHAASKNPEVSEYLGIPFAAPPVGALRFAAPQKYNATRTFNASSYSPSCPQRRGFINFAGLAAVNFTLAGDGAVGRSFLEAG